MSCTGPNVESDKPSKYFTDCLAITPGCQLRLSFFFVFFPAFTPTHNMVTSNSCLPHNTRITISSGDSKVSSFFLKKILKSSLCSCNASAQRSTAPLTVRVCQDSNVWRLGESWENRAQRQSAAARYRHNQKEEGGRCYKNKCGCEEALEHGPCTGVLRHQHSSRQIIQLKKT